MVLSRPPVLPLNVRTMPRLMVSDVLVAVRLLGAVAALPDKDEFVVRVLKRTFVLLVFARFICLEARSAVPLDAEECCSDALLSCLDAVALTADITFFTDVATAILRFLLSLPPFSFPIASCNLRFADGLALIDCSASLMSLVSFCFGPRTPRQDGLPQRHAWIFLEENGLHWSVKVEHVILLCLLKIIVICELFTSHNTHLASK